ncbi:hypothetical protein PFISCL1PPCAC_9038, partial [Pristionchus fissidentatus]
IVDRRMKLGLFHFLCIFAVIIAEDTISKVTPALCDGDMICFYPTECKGQPSNQFIHEIFDQSVTDDCKAIVKIRPYTESKWLVELESLDPSVTLIQVDHGGRKLFTCSNTGSSVKAEF